MYESTHNEGGAPWQETRLVSKVELQSCCKRCHHSKVFTFFLLGAYRWVGISEDVCCVENTSEGSKIQPRRTGREFLQDPSPPSRRKCVKIFKRLRGLTRAGTKHSAEYENIFQKSSSCIFHAYPLSEQAWSKIWKRIQISVLLKQRLDTEQGTASSVD